jgi:hypothetical protein
MKLTLWTARITGIIAFLSALALGTAAPASATTSIPPGYVLGSVEWCNYSAYDWYDIALTPGPGTLHVRARHNMSSGRDGVCAYVTDDVPGNHWMNVRVRAQGWSTSAWDANTYSTYAGAIGLHAMPCFDVAYGEVTVNGVKSTATLPFYWCR